MSQDQDSRAIFYIDGLNLYNGIKELKMPQLKWLDVVELAKNIAMERKHSVLSVKYFTAIVHGGGPENRQETYIAALQASHRKLFKLTKGVLKTKNDIQCSESECRKKITCQHCQKALRLTVEKRTDVNIACQMMSDLYENKFDVAYLISGDSDLLAPIEMVASKKTIIVVFPRNKGTKAIVKLGKREECAIYCSEISEEMLGQCMLPAEVQAGKKTYRRPDKWK